MSDLIREAVQRHAFMLAERERAVEREREDLAVAIRTALSSGVPAAEVAELAGISKARVYQIRDGRR